MTAVIAVLILLLRVGGCTDRLFFHPYREPTPAPAKFPEARVVWFESSDGTRLCGWFIPARGSAGQHLAGGIADASGRSPTILHVHGNAGNMNWHLDFTSWIPAQGFNLFLFDYRGFGESHGSVTGRRAVISDAVAALDAMLALPEVDSERIALFGQSLGGAVGLSLLGRRSDFKCAVLESPFASWRLAAATALGGSRPNVIVRALCWLFVSDGDAPIDALSTTDTPILIIHGANDTLVPVVHGERLRDSSPDQVTLLAFEGGGHNTLQETHPEARRAVLEFLRKHLE
ncbi:MAG: alpha/beta fold hydrolase [Phycisphaeraceae bacterium]|nr:alpha/beta fold hydrolase [Phycisphaeraceae bacterium]